MVFGCDILPHGYAGLQSTTEGNNLASLIKVHQNRRMRLSNLTVLKNVLPLYSPARTSAKHVESQGIGEPASVALLILYYCERRRLIIGTLMKKVNIKRSKDNPIGLDLNQRGAVAGLEFSP